MSISNYLPNSQSSYTWFLYLGIAFFITHIMIYGFGLNLSYFGMILIYIGARKPYLSNWFRNLLWVFVILDIYATISTIRDKLSDRFFVTFDKKLKEGAKSSKKKGEGESESDSESESESHENDKGKGKNTK